ncbi:actin-like protein arp8 [Agyrium rufum]|nr:actin-like protein arp8 [Agyrium rufum]
MPHKRREYLKRDDQILHYRLLQEEHRNRLAINAKIRDRARAHAKNDDDMDVDGEDDEGMAHVGEAEDDKLTPDKIIVIHPGSQNLRIGLGSDPLPKTVPMVIARRAAANESEDDPEPKPKRQKLDDGSFEEPEKMFGQEFSREYKSMCDALKIHMRANKRRVLPNSKELVVNYNKRTPPDTIHEHNDPMRIEWTELPKNPKQAPKYFVGNDALRIPDNSNPRYKLFWPIRHGWFNERDYQSRRQVYDDFALIIEEAIKQQLNLRNRRDWAQYGCVFLVPDFYERRYVTQIVDMCLQDFGFAKVAIMQESQGAAYGAGYSQACIVDIGAQKTSICCMEDAACMENTRINLKYGGSDVTEMFMKMMLYDHFPYEEINLNRRYDFLLAEELKSKFCTMNEAQISVQTFDFHLRAPGQDTRKYYFKTYDEILLAPQCFFQPGMFETSTKLQGRRKLIRPSENIYDWHNDDPTSTAQAEIIQAIAPTPIEDGQQSQYQQPSKPENQAPNPAISTPARQIANPFNRLQVQDQAALSNAGSPAPEGDGTPAPTNERVTNGTYSAALDPSRRDDVLSIAPLHTAILTSIAHAARGDERRTRDFLGGIMVVGGGSQIPGFTTFLEEKLKETRPGYAKDIMIGTTPRDMDPQMIVWKGGWVLTKLGVINECWVSKMEYDRLGSRCIIYKTMFTY